MWKLTWRLYRESWHRRGRERQAPSSSTGVVTTARTRRELGQHGRPHRAVERKTNRRPVKARPGAAGRVGWAHSVRWTACRYADDGLVHCRNEQEAQALKAELQARLAECRLEMHPTKTKIVYCKGGKRKRYVSEHSIRLPRILLPAPAGSTLPRQHAVLGLQPGGQRLGAESHAGDDSGIEPTTSHKPYAPNAQVRFDEGSVETGTMARLLS
jgi:hypothetical protein